MIIQTCLFGLFFTIISLTNSVANTTETETPPEGVQLTEDEAKAALTAATAQKQTALSEQQRKAEEKRQKIAKLNEIRQEILARTGDDVDNYKLWFWGQTEAKKFPGFEEIIKSLVQQHRSYLIQSGKFVPNEYGGYDDASISPELARKREYSLNAVLSNFEHQLRRIAVSVDSLPSKSIHDSRYDYQFESLEKIYDRISTLAEVLGVIVDDIYNVKFGGATSPSLDHLIQQAQRILVEMYLIGAKTSGSPGQRLQNAMAFHGLILFSSLISQIVSSAFFHSKSAVIVSILGMGVGMGSYFTNFWRRDTHGPLSEYSEDQTPANKTPFLSPAFLARLAARTEARRSQNFIHHSIDFRLTFSFLIGDYRSDETYRKIVTQEEGQERLRVNDYTSFLILLERLKSLDISSSITCNQLF